MDDPLEEDSDSLVGSDEEGLKIDFKIEGSLLNEAKDLIVQHCDITPYNAIQINQRYIDYLESLRQKVKSLIELCDKRYTAIEEFLENKNNFSDKKKHVYWQSARNYGYPFFKVPGGKRAPDNEDHLEKMKRGELLPVDYVHMKRKNWTLLDQKNLLDGVKSAMILFHSHRVESAIKVLQRRRKIPGRLTKIESLLAEKQNVADMPFDRLWDCVKDCPDFHVDWDLVSIKNLNLRHSAIECQSMWKLHLSPELNRTPWASDEEDVLLNAVERLGEGDWEKIAMKVGHRSEFQCFVHYQTNFGLIDKIEFRKKFTPEEDQKLLKLVEKYRFGDSICWTRLGSEFEYRTKHTLYKRYHYSLNPNIDHSRWTAADDCVLMAAIEEYGTNFSKIVQEVMPNRTVPQLRSRYSNSLLSVGNNNIWTAEEDEALVNQYENEKKTWADIANALRTHNRISCRTRYRTIKKFLEANPEKSVKDVPRKLRRLTTNITRENWKERMVEIHNKTQEEHDPFRETSMIDRKYFKYFMTSYDFKFGEELRPQRPVTNNLCHIANVLDFKVTRNQLNFAQHNFTDNQLMHLKSIAGKHIPDPQGILTSLCLPPNWSTIAAFRGIAATLAMQQSNPGSSVVPTNVPEVQDFKARFRKMFYWTALLSRIPQVASNSCDIEEIVDEELIMEETPKASTSTRAEHNNSRESPALYYVIEYDKDEYVIKEISRSPIKKRTFGASEEESKGTCSKRIKTDSD
ncbi:snRNA-activating protein complex subunit 4 homolog [Lutzomyia longipalpis]|uniref:snRNA-activating protein complex subunit 4 homolog n=1 Tax=Lutzomyia longipalpis TaxID=7200 RepID=UPI002483364A|nr:snRNA-activating protein complex subunit 4 homolog [Lutzomyia longipalpis]